MRLDSKLQFSDAQALTVIGAVSTNVIDLAGDINIGKGEPMGVAIIIGVDADIGDTDETYQFSLQTATDAAFTTPVALMTTEEFDGSTLKAGAIIVIPVGWTNLQFLRLNSVLGGTTPTVTISAYLQPLSMIDGDNILPVNYIIE